MRRNKRKRLNVKISFKKEYLATLTVDNHDFIFEMSGGNNPVLTVAVSDSTPATPPDAPQSLTATPGDGQVALSWDVPASNGGSPITGYEVSCDTGTANWGTATGNTFHTFTGLTNGTTYTLRVRAVNIVGEGAETTATATPQATVKSVTVGTQSGALTAGTAGSVTFSVTTANIANGMAITLNNTNNVAGITMDATTTTNDSTIITIRTTAATPAGNHPLTLTIDGVTSNNFTLGVNGGADTTLPTVISVSPSGTGVSRSGSIVITLCEPTSKGCVVKLFAFQNPLRCMIL